MLFNAINFYNEKKIELIEYFRFSRCTGMFKTWEHHIISLKMAFDQTKNNDQMVAKLRANIDSHSHPLNLTYINVYLHKLTFRISDKLPRTYHHHHMHIFVSPSAYSSFHIYLHIPFFTVRQKYDRMETSAQMRATQWDRNQLRHLFSLFTVCVCVFVCFFVAFARQN